MDDEISRSQRYRNYPVLLLSEWVMENRDFVLEELTNLEGS